MKHLIYPTEELFCDNEQKKYPGTAGCVDFLLGGIGTGNVSLGARGNLTTWQIFNQPGQLNRMPYTFFPSGQNPNMGRRLQEYWKAG